MFYTIFPFYVLSFFICEKSGFWILKALPQLDFAVANYKEKDKQHTKIGWYKKYHTAEQD